MQKFNFAIRGDLINDRRLIDRLDHHDRRDAIRVLAASFHPRWMRVNDHSL
jgi:hypothetical protein